MENLDDFMKKKMLDGAPNDGEHFEFKEEYWQQAEALIVADERRRRRRRFFWWLSSGVFVLALSAVWWCMQQPEGAAVSENTAAPALENPATEGISAAGEAQKHAPSVAKGDTILEIKAHDQQSVSGQNLTVQPSATASNDVSSENKSFKNQRAEAGAPAAHPKPSANPRHQRHNPKDGLPKSPSEITSNPIQSKGQNPSGVQNALGLNGPTSLAGKANDQEPDNQPGTAKDQLQPGGNPPNAVPREEQPDILLLPTLLRPLLPLVPNLPHILLQHLPVAETNKIPGGRRFGLGLTAFGSGYFPSESTQRFGFGAGLSADWRLGSTWYLQASPLWRVRTMGDFVTEWGPQNAAQLRYSFGFERDEYTLESMASHWLEIPVALQWRQGPWRAEAGVAPGFLLSVQGRLTQVRETSLTARSTTRKAVRLDDAPFYKNYVAVFAGGQYALTKSLGLGVRLHYLGGDFRRQTDEYTPPRQTLWLDAGLHWNLF